MNIAAAWARVAVAVGVTAPFSSPSTIRSLTAQRMASSAQPLMASAAQVLTLAASGAVIVPLTAGSPARRYSMVTSS